MIALSESLTVAEKSAACGVTEKTLRNWWALGCPREASVDETLAWREQRFGKREKPAAEGGDDLRERKLLAEAIKIEAEGRIKEMEARVREGELVSRSAVESWLSKFISATAQRIEAIPELVVPELPLESRAVSHQILTEFSRMILSDLADMPEEMWADESITEDA